MPLPAGINLVELVGKRAGEGIQLVLESAEHVSRESTQPLQAGPKSLAEGALIPSIWMRGDRNSAVAGLMSHFDLLGDALVDQVVTAVIDRNRTVRLGDWPGSRPVARVARPPGCAGRSSRWRYWPNVPPPVTVGDLDVELWRFDVVRLLICAAMPLIWPSIDERSCMLWLAMLLIVWASDWPCRTAD